MSKPKKDIPAHYNLEHCLNCEEPLVGHNYCPNCGQMNADRDISIWTLIQDFLGDYFSFDSKFFSTLIPLFTKPGSVPKAFIEGHRVAHIPPFRVLIFSSFIFFTVWSLTFIPDPDDPKTMSSILGDEFNLNKDNVGPDTDGFLDDGDAINFSFSSDSTSSFNKDIGAIFNGLDEGLSVQKMVDSVAVEASPFQKKFYTQVGKMYTSDRGTLAKYFISNLSLMILIIQPFFALFLMLIYLRSRKNFKYIRHLVFSFYYHAWFLVTLTIGVLIQHAWSCFPLKETMALLSSVYLAIALKRYYEQSWIKTTLKLIITWLFYPVLALLFAVLSFITSFYFF